MHPCHIHRSSMRRNQHYPIRFGIEIFRVVTPFATAMAGIRNRDCNSSTISIVIVIAVQYQKAGS